MLNQVVIVGRLTNQLEEKEGNSYITLACPRNYKNEEGVYETDFITCRVQGGIAENVKEYCKKGDIVGVKGRIQVSDTMEIITEKVTFLSSKSGE